MGEVLTRTEARPREPTWHITPANVLDERLASILSFNHSGIMGRSAKFAKRPTKKEKVASKTAKESRRPLPPPPPPPVEEADGGPKGPKKRRTMRAKVDQVRLV